MAAYRKNLKRSATCEVCDCQPSVCDPCFVCPTPTLKCDSVAISKSKEYCGYLNPEDGKHYLKMVTANDHDDTPPDEIYPYNGGGFCGGTITYHQEQHAHYSVTSTLTKNEDGTCSESVTHTGSASSAEWYDIVYWPNTENYGITRRLDDMSCNSTLAADGTWSGTSHYKSLDCDNGDLLWDNTYVVTKCNENGADVVTYSEEETISTSDLISDAMSDLPAFPGTWTGSCESAFDLSDDEDTVSITHARVKFTVADPLPAGQRMTITYRITFWPEEGSPLETENTTTIEPESSESGVIDLPIPDEDGTLDIAFVEAVCESTS